MKRLMIAVLVLGGLLTVEPVVAAPEDRFKGGINDGYDKNSVLDAPVPALSPRIKVNGVPYEQIKSINGAEPRAIINGVRIE